MTPPKSTRRDFLKVSALAGAGASLSALGAGCAGSGAKSITLPSGVTIHPDIGLTRPRPAGQKPVHDLTTKRLERVRIGCIGCGGRGAGLMREALGVEFADIVAVCDLRPQRAEAVATRVANARGQRPQVYAGTENIWEQLCEREDLDVIYVATPWAWHVPMAVRAMERGKHAFVEVSAAVTVDECWQLVDTSERMQRHCVMLENCCYGENELFVLNMARAGVFGELTHAECAYIHDLRGLLFNLNGEGEWRRQYHLDFDGNLYPTHGLGPVAQYLGIGRGDQFRFLVSMSSPEKGLTRFRDERNPNGGAQSGEKYIGGDMNTSLIKTMLGRTIMLQHDVISPRPYSRINALSGTGATFFDYPARLALNDPKAFELQADGSHAWLNAADLAKMRERFTHPLWSRLRERARAGGHGGMDFVMTWRHLDCVRTGHTPDSVVYDAAAWSSILELSALSVASDSLPVPIPDFTRGLWKTMSALPIVEG